MPETTHRAYSGKNEQRLATTCFWALRCPPTSMKAKILFALSIHFSTDCKLWLWSLPFESKPMTWWLLDWVVPLMNSCLWVNTFNRAVPLPSSFYPLFRTAKRVLFPDPLSPERSTLTSNLTPNLCFFLISSSRVSPLNPSPTFITMTSAATLLANRQIVLRLYSISSWSSPVGLPLSSTPMR